MPIIDSISHVDTLFHMLRTETLLHTKYAKIQSQAKQKMQGAIKKLM